MQAKEIDIADGSCVEYIIQHRKRSDYYYAIFAVKVRLTLLKEEYEKLRVGTKYVFIKPVSLNSLWLGFPKE